MDPIHIALASDLGYLPGLRVTAASIAYHANEEAHLIFHILDGGIQDELFEDLRLLLANTHSQVAVHRYRIDKLELRVCPEYSGSRLTYARLLLPSLLPEVHHVIYCDCDFLWCADIAELWRERNDSIVLQSTLDGIATTEEREERWFVSHGYKFDASRYFCAGLSFYNLELCRKMHLSRQVFDFLRLHPDVNCADQTAMNAILFGQVRMLPRKWQRLTRSVTAAELNEPVVLHYADELPWRRPAWWNLLTDTILIWHRFNDFLLETRGGSLPLFFSGKQIICKRGLELALQVWPIRWTFYQALALSGRGTYREYFDVWSRSLPQPPSRPISKGQQHTTGRKAVTATGPLRWEIAE